MAKAIAIYAGGIHGLRQKAVRSDGVVFARYQEKGWHGRYVWTKWRWDGGYSLDPANLPTTLESGFATLYMATPDSCLLNNRALFNDKGEIRARLPD